MSRISKLYLDDILESCRNVRDYTNGMSFDNFAIDNKTIDAVVRNLEIIGEAVKCLPPDLLNRRPDIPWKKIARFRDIVVHHYFKVDLEVVWDVIQNQITQLEAAVNDIANAANRED
jgi:uncharacterized protein with HEPN domain